MEAEDLLAEASGAKAAGREIADLRFGPVAQSARGARWKPVDARNLFFRNVEWLHGSMLGRLLVRGRVLDCRFERVNLDDFDAKKVDFLDCHFDRVTFGEEFLGLIKDCTFTRCSFVRCRFDAVGIVESTLRACRFVDLTGTDRARWDDCLLEDVTFAGGLDGVRFLDCVFRNVDMSEAKLHEVSILDTKEGEAKLPDRPENFAVHAELFLDIETALRSKLGSEAMETYRDLAKMLSRFGSPFILDAALLEVLLKGLSADDRAVVMATLYEMRERRSIWASFSSAARRA
jgi:hypothetical protein